MRPFLLQRLGTPEGMAEIALFLAMDGSSHMTGSILIADGGCTATYGLEPRRSVPRPFQGIRGSE